MADAATIEIPDLRGAALKAWATKNGLNYDEVKAAQQAAKTDDEPPPAAKKAPKKADADELSRDYTFRVIPTHSQAGRNLNLKIIDPSVVPFNGNSQFIVFNNYQFVTKSRVIRDYLRAGIKDGTFPYLFEDVQVLMRCTVKNCAFKSTQTGSAGLAELNAHFMAEHASTVDEDGDEDE